jgi:hypothetical protein
MPAHSIAFSRTISPAHASVLDDAVHNLADHFEADGLAWTKAVALAHKVLCVDPAQLQAALESIEIEATAHRADMAVFRAKARAVEASYIALVQ